MIFAMMVFGTVGIFVRYISLPSSVIALVRGCLGTGFLLIFSLFRKTKVDKSAIRANLLDWTVSEKTYVFPYTSKVTAKDKTVQWHGDKASLCYLCFGEEVAIPVDSRSMDYPDILKRFSA